jgi:hypothetical protein
MIVLNSLTPKFIGVGMSVLSSTRIEQEFFVDPKETLIPEQVFVEDVGGDNLGGNTAREVFDSLPWPSTINGVKVPVCFGKRFLN